ncbi:MAG: GNAT family N-acetyltransferase [Anaerolineae bacterium]|nr:GNAT family N-acetyltransferase [Anaerolineae bacterium]
MLLGSIEISDYLDLIVRPADLSRFVTGLLDFLASRVTSGWRALDWYNLPEASPTLPALEADASARGWTFTREVYQPAPYIPLPADFETYLAGIDKKQRHEIRRKMRRAAESEIPVRWYLVEDESALESEMEAFFALMSQDPAKEEFLTEPMRRQMLAAARTALRGGWLWLAFLEVGGKKAAGAFNFDYGNIFPRLGSAGVYASVGLQTWTKRVRLHARERGIQVSVWREGSEGDEGEGNSVIGNW